MTIRVSGLRCKPFPQDLTFVRLEIRSGSWMKMLLTIHNIPYGDVGFGHHQGFWEETQILPLLTPRRMLQSG